MLQQNTQNNRPIRVLALGGFYAQPTGGGFGIVSPGDVVELDHQTAKMLIASNKAQETDKPPKRQTDYLPERKRNPKKEVPQLLEALLESNLRLTAAVESLVAERTAEKKAAGGKSGGEKA